MAQDYSPNFPQNTVNSYTVNGIKFKSTTPSFETSNDLYTSVQKVQQRSYNLGCTGYRTVIANSVGQISPLTKQNICSDLYSGFI